MNSNELISAFRGGGQGHVFAFLDKVGPGGRRRLLAQAAEIDLGEVSRLASKLGAAGAAAVADLRGLAPAPYEKLPEAGGDRAAWARAAARFTAVSDLPSPAAGLQMPMTVFLPGLRFSSRM